MIYQNKIILSPCAQVKEMRLKLKVNSMRNDQCERYLKHLKKMRNLKKNCSNYTNRIQPILLFADY